MARIGVTGHRHYRSSVDTDAAIQAVLQRITEDGLAPTIISSLAEGADRHVTDLALQIPGARLQVVLPLPPAVFMDDFTTAESRHEFLRLVDLADSVHIVDADPAVRDVAYERAGHETVHRSDVLIAVWDGDPARGRGGTVEIIQYALDHEVMVEIVLVDRDSA